MVAARRGDEAAVRALLRQGANPDYVLDGWTPLISACFFGHTEVVQALLDRGADTTIAEPTAGFSPLMLTAVNGHLGAAKLLVDRGADVRYANLEGETALFVATFSGFAEISKLLLEKGADPSAQTKQGWSILMAAADNGRVETLQYILDRRVDLNVAAVDGATALMFAAGNRHEAAAELLLKEGAHPNITQDSGYTALNILLSSIVELHADGNFYAVLGLLLKHGADPNIADETDWPPLLVASYFGELNAVRMLLAYGADPRPRSALVYPLLGAVLNGHDDIVSVLLEAGASPNYKNKYDTTVLHHAIVGGSDRIGLELIRHGADVNLPSNGESPAFEAASYGRIPVLAAILEAGGDPNWVGAEGLAPLHAAVQNDDVSAVDLLLRAGANPNLYHPESTPLLAAVSHDQELIVKLLLDHKADPNQRGGAEEVTPLQIATRRANLTIARELLEVGANPNLPTKAGRVALQDAYTNRNLELAELLHRHGADLDTLAAGASLIFLAAYQGLSDWVDLLLRLGADADRASVGGNTPLLVSLAQKHWPIALALTSHGVDVNRANERGATALAVAINHNNADLVEALIARGADVNRLSPEGWVPLTTAIASKNIAVFQLLMRNGADLQRRDACGRSPLELAVDTDQFLMAQALIRAGATASANSIIDWISSETINRIQLYDDKLYNNIMDLLDQQIQHLRTIADKSPGVRDEIARTLSELAKRLGAPDGAAGPVVAPLQLPSEPVNKYKGKTESGDPIAYFNKHWKKYLDAGVLYQDDLRRLEGKLLQALYNEARIKKIDPASIIPPARKRRTDDALEAAPVGSPEYELARRRAQTRARTARYRAKAAKPAP